MFININIFECPITALCFKENAILLKSYFLTLRGKTFPHYMRNQTTRVLIISFCLLSWN